MVYVDGNAPPAVAHRVETLATARRFTLLRSPHHLSPNQARNLALGHVRTKYTVFLGNDVLVADGWLESLTRCAEETGASFVSGVSCWPSPDEPVVYCAGGETHIVDDGRSRTLCDVHHHAGRRFVDVRAGLRRQPSEAATFHCVLVRTDVLQGMGGLDEQLHVLDHVDLCLRAHREGAGGWFEPTSVVTYVPPHPLRFSDLPFFLLRWSRAWIESSFAHFCHKWDIDPRDPTLEGNRRWLHDHRWRVLGAVRRLGHLRVGHGALTATECAIDAVVTNTIVRRHAHQSGSLRALVPVGAPSPRT